MKRAKLTFSLLPVLLIFLSLQLKAVTADFTVSATIGCAPKSIVFYNTSSGATSYEWDFGDLSTHLSIASPTHSYSSAGSYTVKLTAYSSSGATSTKTLTINLYDPPTVYFRASDTSICVCNTVNFYDSSILSAPGTGTYNWQFGTGAVSAARNPSYPYCTANTTGYTVILKTTNSATCYSSLSKPFYIHVYDHPACSFSADKYFICGLSGTVNFTSAVSGSKAPYTYDWDFGDASTHATTANPSHPYSSTTYKTFKVRLVVTSAAGCKDTLTDSITLTHATPAMSITPASGVICANEYVAATNVSPPSFDATEWKWGDGNTSSDATSYHMYATAGTYILKLIDTYNGCKDSTTDTIVVHPIPVIKFGASPLQPCPAPVTISFTDSSSTLTMRLWKFGDTATSGLKNPTHTYMRDSAYDVTLVGTNSYGCKDSLTKYAYIKVYDFRVDAKANGNKTAGGCHPLTVDFFFSTFYIDPVTLLPVGYPYSIASVSWDFGDGSLPSTDLTPRHRYLYKGIYNVIVTVTTVNGCTATDTLIVKTGSHPHASFYAPVTTGCAHHEMDFVNQSDSANEFEWNFGNLGTTTSYKIDTVHFRFPDTGTFTITLVAKDYGCPDTMVIKDYIHILLPVCGFNNQFVCDSNLEIKFDASVSKGADTYLWDFGDSSSSTTIVKPHHFFPAAGSYSVQLAVYNNVTGCHDTFKRIVAVFEPSLDFVASDTLFCLGKQITLTAFLTGIEKSGWDLNWKWTIDRSIHILDTGRSIQYTFTDTGFHNIRLAVSDVRDTAPYKACQDTAFKPHYIGVAHPYVKFKANPLIGCPPFTTLISDSSVDIKGVSITSRRWDFGDSTSGSFASGYHVYNNIGSYYEKLVVTDAVGCTDSLTKPGYIQVVKPVASFFAIPVNVCQGAPTSLFNGSIGGSSLASYWKLGDGDTSHHLAVNHTYKDTGYYTVTLYVTDVVGCKDTLVKPNYIKVIAKPRAAFTLDDSFKICPPLLVNFTNHSKGAASYIWDFGDPTSVPSTITSPSWTYVNPGYYTVMLVAFNVAGCSDTATAKVNLLGYKGELSYTPLIGCAPLWVNFNTKVKGVPKFIFDFDDGTSFTTTDTFTTHTYTTPGPKVPKLIMTDGLGCSSESEGLDTIFVDGVYHGFFVRPYPTCDSGTIQLLDTSVGAYSTIVKRTWIFHDAVVSHDFGPFHTYHAPGVYSVILVDSTSSGCVDTFKSSVHFYNSPDIDAGPDTTICLGDSATLIPTGGVVYTWSPAATLSCATCYYPKAVPATATAYVVRGTDIHGCQNTDTVTVFVKIKTTSYAKPGGEICQGEYTQLGDSAGVYSTYRWVPKDWLNNADIANPVGNPDTTITYTVIAKQGSCVEDTQYVKVLVHPRPTPDLGPDRSIIAGDELTLHVSGFNLYKLSWTPAEYLSCDSCQDPVATPKNKRTTFYVQAWSDFGCRDSDNVTIIVVCDQSQVFMPNTFTPNGDGQNDIFYPRGKGLRIIKSFRIYNRWGQLMFETHDINTNQKENGWDGTFNGQKLESDVFVYIVDAICDTGDPMSWKGDISIIK